MTAGRGLSRRHLLTSGAALAGGAVLGTSCSSDDAGSASTPDTSQSAGAFISHLGERQPGILTTPPRHALVAAFDTTAATLDEVRTMLSALAVEADHLTAGTILPEGDPLLPPPDNRILGAMAEPDDLTITVGLGASMFDDRFGLRSRKPTQLVAMPSFPNDQPDNSRSHGDVVVQICARRDTTLHHTIRRLMRATRSSLTLRWMQAGFQEPNTLGVGRTSTRNMLGFKDGTANLDSADAAKMDDLVWVQPTDDEPAWAVGGTYQVVRLIRNRVEFWDRTPLRTQELIMGRTKETGAPLDGTTETDLPRFTDADGAVTPLTAHIRLANPRTAGTERNLLLRRGFNFANGFTKDGHLDQGLLFVCFQRSLADGFLAVQERLNGEALEEYITPIGGGFFFVPRGRREAGEPFAAALLD
jgi:deferrochelatase/peroxidase EfeB